jgi:hypothetical protein
VIILVGTGLNESLERIHVLAQEPFEEFRRGALETRFMLLQECKQLFSSRSLRRRVLTAVLIGIVDSSPVNALRIELYSEESDCDMYTWTVVMRASTTISAAFGISVINTDLLRGMI